MYFTGILNRNYRYSKLKRLGFSILLCTDQSRIHPFENLITVANTKAPLIITCHSSSPVKWYHNGNILLNNTNPTLHFSFVHKMSIGSYECEGTTQLGLPFSAVSFILYGKCTLALFIDSRCSESLAGFLLLIITGE